MKRTQFDFLLTPQLGVLAFILIVNWLLFPGFFNLSWQDGRLFGSMIDVLNRGAPVAILAVGMSAVIATRGIDLSVGAVMAVAGAVAATEAVEQKKTGTLLRELRDTLNNNPQNLADVIRTDPVREGNHIIGYRVNPGRDRQVIARFGLTSGDIITAVNGVHLDSPAKGATLLQTLQTAKQMTIEVLRSGVTQTLSFDIDL